MSGYLLDKEMREGLPGALPVEPPGGLSPVERAAAATKGIKKPARIAAEPTAEIKAAKEALRPILEIQKTVISNLKKAEKAAQNLSAQQGLVIERIINQSTSPFNAMAEMVKAKFGENALADPGVENWLDRINTVNVLLGHSGKPALDLSRAPMGIIEHYVDALEPDQIKQVATRYSIPHDAEAAIPILKMQIKKAIRDSKEVSETIAYDLLDEKPEWMSDFDWHDARISVRRAFDEIQEGGPLASSAALQAIRPHLIEQIRRAQDKMAEAKKWQTTQEQSLLRQMEQKTGLGHKAPPEQIADAYLRWFTETDGGVWVSGKVIGELMHAPNIAAATNPFYGYLKRDLERVLARTSRGIPGQGPTTLASRLQLRIGVKPGGMSEKPPEKPISAFKPEDVFDSDFPTILDAKEAALELTKGVVFGNAHESILSRRMMLDTMERLIQHGQRIGDTHYIGPSHWLRFRKYFPDFFEYLEEAEAQPEGKADVYKPKQPAEAPAMPRTSFSPAGRMTYEREAGKGAISGRGALRWTGGPKRKNARRLRDPRYAWVRGMLEMNADLF